MQPRLSQPMSPKRRRRSNLFRLGLLLISASACQQVDACNKGCSSCQSAADGAADNATSCDCGGNPGASGHDDGPWYEDYGGDGTPDKKCQWPQASCDGPPDDATSCESHLQRAETCGHCLRNCGQDACIDTDDGWFCEATVHEQSAVTGYTAVAADETLLAWRTEASTFALPQQTDEAVDLGVVLREHAIHDGSVYGVSPAGDVVRYVFPDATAEVIAPGPSDAQLLRFDLDQVYWVQDGGIVRAPVAGGAVEPVVSIDGYEIEDYEVDDTALWLAGFFYDVPRFYHVTKSTWAEHEIENTGGTSLDATVDVELGDSYVYFGRGSRLLFVERNDWGMASDIGALPEYRDEMIARGAWFYVREADRIVATQPENDVMIELVVHPGVIGSMSVARDRVFFTTTGTLSSVAW